MDYRKVAEGILATVGGKENIQDVTHCLTRLRLVLKNREAIDLKDIEKCEGVMGVVEQGGQVQVIIGTKVEHVYDEFCKLVDVSAISKNGNVSEGQTWYGKI
ncbi:MAG: PTS transporter subunit EIIB, partial [Erysipelotrichaceae bacterium]|nr:PTS transporter subunit EIIB [Erysipelotrichaceae bacterium]